MSHIVFFSYARKDEDRFLLNFFTHLCQEIAPHTIYTPEDERISFLDKSDLPLMENWRANIASALQSSAVMVCITSTKYLNSKFCGQEFYVFNKRRRQGLTPGQPAPPVVLPLIWVPAGPLPAVMNEVQQVPKEVPDSYLTHGLRHMAIFEPAVYDRCVSAFAKAIIDAWKTHEKKIKPLAALPAFEEIPNAFAGGEWSDAIGPDGAWLPGPEVANFVFVAESKDDSPQPEGRYGADGSEWRPYFPSEPETALDHATKAVRKRFKFREIRVNDDLPDELERARKRKNLSILIGDPMALPLDSFKAVRSIEKLWWEGCTVLIPCHEAAAKFDEQDGAVKDAFPVISQVQSSNFGRPRTPAALQAALDLALCKMSHALTQQEIDKRDKTDPPPPGLSGVAAPRS